MSRFDGTRTRAGLGLAALFTWLSLGGCSCEDAAPPPVTTCAQLQCAAHQLCTEAAGSTAAACAPACEAGFAWSGAACEASATATCDALPAAGSIALRCEMEHRTCAEATPGAATCTTCLGGFVEVSGACEELKTCTALACSTQNRACEPTPIARCTTCLDGFIEDGAECRAPKTCADITCGPGETCFAMAGVDAMCRAGNCPDGQAPRASGGGCVRCTVSCAGRPGGTGRVYTEVASLADTCICETEDGFYWDDGAFGGGDIRACDADGDGWVRLNARRAIQRTDDLAIKTNARCSVHTIDRVLLVNDEGSQREIALAAPVDLYEPERLDDGALLQDAIDQGTLPAYDGRPLHANELDTLTKACVWKATPQQQADFNQNGLEDLDEAHHDPRLQSATDPLAPLYDFTYFIELYRGWYEAPTTPGGHGRYVIAEKHRAAAEPDPRWKLAIAPAPSDGGDYWRSCERQRDAAYQPAEAGFDFAEHEARDVWAGMGHHSQFRCLRVVANGTGAANEATPEELTQAWTLNRCTAGGTSPALGDGATPNPSDPALSCTLGQIPDPRTSATAPVVLAVSKYLPYDDAFTPVGHGYVRGCINACAVHADRCPGFDPDPGRNTATCFGVEGDFGRLFCGCTKLAAGADCSYACPGDLATAPGGSLFLGSDFDARTRAGTWLCGRPSTTSGALGAPGGYQVTGEVPAIVTPTAPLCEAPGPAGTCSGFGVRAYAH